MVEMFKSQNEIFLEKLGLSSVFAKFGNNGLYWYPS
jgi:hypothetical protein